MKGRRRAILVVVCLLLAGGIVNILVAWAATASAVARDPEWYMRVGLMPEYASAPGSETRMLIGTDPPVGGMVPPLPDAVVRDFLVEAWELLYTRGRGVVTGATPAAWPAPAPAHWPETCLCVAWEGSWAMWSIGYTYRPDPEAADPSDWLNTALMSYMIDTYRVGWPMRSLEVRWWYEGKWNDASEETLSSFDGIPAPRLLTDRGFFASSGGRIPTRPLTAGFALNTLFYATILALPLSFFPIRRHLRARRGRCPKCNYDRASLDPTAPCPECGAAR